MVDAGDSHMRAHHLEIFTAVASLIRAQRYEIAMAILENEIDDINSNIDL